MSNIIGKKQFVIALMTGAVLLCLCLNKTLAQVDLEVNGIVYDEKEGSFAVVNGKTVKVGDTIKGAKVAEITNDNVVFKRGDKTFVLGLGQVAADESANIPLSSLGLGKTSLDNIIAVLKAKNINYYLTTGDLQFKIRHKYKDYLDAPYTITLSFKDKLFDNVAEYELFFTPKGKVLYRVEINTDGDKNKFLKFFIGKYNKGPNYSDACYYWLSKPDPATGELFYNVLFCPNGAYSPTITLSWTDWDYLYPLAVMEGIEIRTKELKKK